MIDWRLGVYENAAEAAADDELLLKRPLTRSALLSSLVFFYVSRFIPVIPAISSRSLSAQYTSEEKKRHHAIDWFASIKVSPQLL